MNEINRSHCTQFMLDFVANQEKKDKNSFQDYVKREDNYDLSFCNTWINFINIKCIDTPKKMLDCFIKIQETAMHHIKVVGKTMTGETYSSGIYARNSYCVGIGQTSDFEGIKELCSQIWFDRKDIMLSAYPEKNENGFYNYHYLNKDGFFHRTPISNTNTQIFSNNGSKEILAHILKTVKNYYDVGYLEGGFSPIRIQPLQSAEEKKSKQLNTLMTI